MNNQSLTEKQKRFCIEYLIDFSAGAAYLRAGYKTTQNSAYVGAHHLLRNPKIQAHLQALRTEIGNQTNVTLARTLEEIAHVAFSRITHTSTFDNNGMHLKNSKNLSESELAAIASVTSTTTQTADGVTCVRSVKLHNKVAALSLLAKFFGIGSDFNQARAALKKYGLALIEAPDSELGYRLEKHIM